MSRFSRVACKLRESYRRTVKGSYLSLLAVVVGAVSLWGQARPVSEYEVKAAFLYNFAKLIEWPTAAVAPQFFTMCVAGNRELEENLGKVVAGKVIDGRSIRVFQIHRNESAASCNVLFISADAEHQDSLIRGVAGVSVLLVGEKPGFCTRGGILNFWMEEEHVRFEINPRAARRVHLIPSSNLMRLARIVDAEPPTLGGR